MLAGSQCVLPITKVTHRKAFFNSHKTRNTAFYTNSPAHSVRKPKVLIVAGPTAVGKSKLSWDLLKRTDGVLVNADATKIYRGLEGGANKRRENSAQVRLWDLVDACEAGTFSVGQYHDAAIKELESIIQVEKKLPIVVGGSGLYIRWLMRGKQAGPKRDEVLTESIAQEVMALPWATVIDRIRTFDPVYADGLIENDYRRAIRALEVKAGTGKSISALQRQRTGALHDSNTNNNDRSTDLSAASSSSASTNAIWQDSVDFRPFIVSLPRTLLYDTICRRCENMILDGLILEVWQLMKRGLTTESTPGKAIGYRQTIEYLRRGTFTEQSFLHFLRDFQSKTRQLAHRQLSWFRREPDFLPLTLNDNTGELIANYLELSPSDWAQLVRSCQTVTNIESAAEMAALRTYVAPAGIFLPQRVPRRQRTPETIAQEQSRQNLIQKQLHLLDYIAFEMKRTGIGQNSPTPVSLDPTNSESP